MYQLRDINVIFFQKKIGDNEKYESRTDFKRVTPKKRKEEKKKERKKIK